MRPHLDPGESTPRLLRSGELGRIPDPAEQDDGPSPAGRFDEAVAVDAADGCLAGDEETCRLLRDSPVERIGRIVYSSNATFLVELGADDPAGAGRLRGVYKPARGERPLWDFPRRTLHLREVATYLVDAALGLGLIPATVLRAGPLGPGSIQRFVEPGVGELDERGQRALEAPLRAMAALDALVNNADRKSAHLLVDGSGRLWGIDNALTFLPYPRQRTVLLELGGTALPARVRAAVAGLDADAPRRTALLERVGRLLSAAELEAFSGRLAELAADPTYPQLDAWDGRPFEWF